MAGNTQLSYYQNHKINPVFIETRGDKWKKHLRARNNLYENHLKLPLSWFNGKQILEFGPNGGENSLILAMYGAQITLVEPHQMMHERIHQECSGRSLRVHIRVHFPRPIMSKDHNRHRDISIG